MTKHFAQDKARAWQRWWLVSAPLWVLLMWSTYRFGFLPAALFGVLILVGALLYQRFVNRRAWRSILLGVHASEE